jgi:hypothetical protein
MEQVKKFSDLNIIAHLVCKEFEQAGPPVNESGIIYWFFKNTPELEKEILKHLSGESLVDPVRFGQTTAFVRRISNSLKYRPARNEGVPNGK